MIGVFNTTWWLILKTITRFVLNYFVVLSTMGTLN